MRVKFVLFILVVIGEILREFCSYVFLIFEFQNRSLKKWVNWCERVIVICEFVKDVNYVEIFLSY